MNLLSEKMNLLSEENKKEKKELESKINILNGKINTLTEENKKLKNIINKYEINNAKEKLEEMNKHKEIKQYEKEENGNIIAKNNDFNCEPQKLKFKEYLTNIQSISNLSNFDVYIGLKDQIEYLIYNNRKNYII